MNESELRSKVREIVASVIEIEEFRDDEDFIRDLGVDSMMGLEIVARLERTFRVKIGEEYLPKVRTLNDVVGIVESVLDVQKA